MKPEPLRTKGKRRIEMTTAEWIGRLLMPVNTFPSELKEGCGEILKLRQEKEIVSAVEWLKEQIKLDINNDDTLTTCEMAENTTIYEVLEYIDKAFEDVNK